MGENVSMRRVTAMSLALSAWMLGPHSALAQSYVHHYVASEAIPRQLAVPPNLVVSPMYRPLVAAMLKDSPTFRRQCLRISGEPNLTVRLEIHGVPSRSDVRATTRLTQHDNGRLSALVDIAVRHDLQELIAHEFEHIIEQLDGIDLAARARRPRTGVTTLGRNADVYETTRAKRIGLRVVSELAR